MAKAWKMAKENTDVGKEADSIVEEFKQAPAISESQPDDRDDSSHSSSSGSESD